jgi:hypothetical protein
MPEFTQLQKEIIRYIRRERIAMREDIIRDVSYDACCTRKEVQEQLSYLRKHGYVWRIPEGWYETDVDI